MKITTVNIREKLNEEQIKIISNIIHDVLANSEHKESLDFYTWNVQAEIISTISSRKKIRERKMEKANDKTT